MIRIMRYGETPNRELFMRRGGEDDVREAVAAIIENVRRNGDLSLIHI